MKAMVLAAGLGLRMRPLTLLRAKPVLPVLNRPLLDWTMARLARAGVRDVVVNLHHLPETVTAVLGSGRRFGLRIRYSREQTILGTGGGPRAVRELFGDEPLLLVNGDVLFDLDLRRLLAVHRASGARATLALRPNPVPYAYSPVVSDRKGRILSIAGRPAAARGARLDVRERARPRPGPARAAARGRLRQRARPLHPAAGRGRAPAGRALAGCVVRFRSPQAVPRRAASAAAGPRPRPRPGGRRGAGGRDRPSPPVGGRSRGPRRRRRAGRAQRPVGRRGGRGGRARLGLDRRDGRGRAVGGEGGGRDRAAGGGARGATARPGAASSGGGTWRGWSFSENDRWAAGRRGGARPHPRVRRRRSTATTRREVSVVPLSGDASTRRYYRLENGARSFVLALYPEPFVPEELSYLVVHALLESYGLPVPATVDVDGAAGDRAAGGPGHPHAAGRPEGRERGPPRGALPRGGGRDRPAADEGRAGRPEAATASGSRSTSRSCPGSCTTS